MLTGNNLSVLYNKINFFMFLNMTREAEIGKLKSGNSIIKIKLKANDTENA